MRVFYKQIDMINSQDSFDDLRIAQYLAGELLPDEAHSFEHYLTRYPDRAAEIRLLKKSAEIVSAMKPEPDVEAALITHHQMRRMSAENALAHTRIPRKEYLGKPFGLTIPRAFVSIVSVCVLLVAYISISGPERSLNESKYVEILSGKRGEPVSASLIDGSRVVLSPGSRLQLSKGFSELNRNVILEGSATFQVNSHISKPFIVKALNTETVVLGTHFGVMTNEMDSIVRVVVNNGKVGIRRIGNTPEETDDQSTIILGASDGATVSGHSVHMQRNINISQELGWETGRLSFEGRALRDVLRSLGEWYGVEFKTDNPNILDKEITITFNNKSISEVIDALGVMLNSTITYEGSVITIKSGK